MLLERRARLVGLLLALLASTPAHADETPRTLSFAEDLYQRADLPFQGVRAERHLDLPLPRAWELTGDPVLHLDLAHSAALIPGRSHLTVSVNGRPLATIPLDATNVAAASVDVRIPRATLDEYNDLGLLVTQHYTDDCEDPFDPSLWTRVLRSSTVSVPARTLPVTAGLEAWPFPLVDRHAAGPVKITPVMTGPASAEAVEAAGDVALALGRLAGYRTVQVEPPVARVEDARTAALVVGTLAEAPTAGVLAGRADLKPDEGLVAVLPNPSDATLPVLVVSGGGADGLRRAAWALAGQDRQPVLSGQVAVVTAAIASAPPAATITRAPAAAFPLSDIGFHDTTVRGYYAEAVRVPVRLEGDAFIKPGGGTLRLKYAYGAQVDPRLSTLEIRLDGLSLRSIGLDDVNGDPDGELTVTLPEDLLDPAANVDAVFHLYPRDYDICRRTTDTQLWGTVFASSTLDIPRDHVARMPDLGRLRFDAWPMTADADGGGVVVVLPNAPAGDAWSAGLEAMALFGRLSVAALPSARLLPATHAAFSQAKDSHFLLMDDGTAHAVVSGLVQAGGLQLLDADGVRTLLAKDRSALASSAAAGAVHTMQQVLQPANPTRSVLVMHAGGDGGLARLVDVLGDAERVQDLEGNAAVVTDDGSVRTVATAERVQWGQLPMATEARIGVRRNWWVLGLSLGVMGLAMAYSVRVWGKGRSGPS